MSKKQKRAVVVTTEHRGVFFGYVEEDKNLPAEITLSQARMCVYWSADVKGVLGLVGSGPSKTCRVTHSIPTGTFYKITGIFDCSPEAAKQWEAGPWS